VPADGVLKVLRLETRYMDGSFDPAVPHEITATVVDHATGAVLTLPAFVRAGTQVAVRVHARPNAGKTVRRTLAISAELEFAAGETQSDSPSAVGLSICPVRALFAL
jgi:hypothetical protein